MTDAERPARIFPENWGTRLYSSRLGRQTLWYVAAQAASAVLGIVVYGLLTRGMSVREFGSYSFVIAFFSFTSVFFDYGISSAGSRLMAMVPDAGDARRRMGLLVLASAAVGVLYSMFVAFASLFIDVVMHKDVGSVLLVSAPLVLVFPMQEMLVSTAQGGNRMRFLSIFYFLPRALLTVLILALVALHAASLHAAVLATLAASALAIIAALAYLRPVWTGLRDEFRVLRAEVREFGRHVYFGRVIDGLTTGLDRMLISAFHGLVPVGFYSIALLMTSPVQMVSRAIVASSYRQFARDARIPRAILLANLLWCTIGAVMLVLACDVLIPLFFTASYAPSLRVLPFLAAGIGLAGLNNVYSAFLSAHRQGRAIRIMSVTTSSLNLVLNLLLIPWLSMTGAGISLIASYAVNIVMNLYFYRITVSAGTAADFTRQAQAQ